MAILRNATTGDDLSTDVERAASPLSRAVGWLGRRTIPPDAGKWLAPCSAVHTLGMRSALDLIFLDAASTVVALEAHVRPGRLYAGRRGTRAIVEMGPGFLASAALRVGDHLTLVEGN